MIDRIPMWMQILIVLTILFAIYAKYYRVRLFGKILTNFVSRLNPIFAPGKQSLFDEAFKKIKKSQPNAAFKVLEIGVGTGTNFKFYPKNCEITISDKTDHLRSYLNDSLKKMDREDLKIGDFLIADAQNMKHMESNSFDAVVATFTCCSMKNLESVLNEIHRVLRPSGVFLFMVNFL